MAMRSNVEEVARASSTSVVHIFAGTLASGVLSAIGLSILGRLLEPRLFGQIALIMVLPTLAVLVQDFALSHAITRYVALYFAKQDVERVRNVVYVGLTSKAFLAVSVTLASLVAAEAFSSNVLLNPSLAPLVRLAVWSILGQSIISSAASVLIGMDKSARYGFILVTSVGLQALLPAILVFGGLSLEGAILGQTSGALLAGLIAVLLLKGQIPSKKDGRKGTPKASRTHLGMMIRYGVPIYVSSLASGFTTQVLYVVAAVFLSLTTLGNYYAAVRLGGFVTFLSIPIMTGLFPAFSKIDHASKDLQALYTQGIKYTTLVAIPLTALLMVLSEPLVLLFYGSAYREAPAYFAISLVVYFYSAIGSLVIGSFLRGQAKNRPYLMMHVVLSVAGITLAFLLTPYLGAYGILISILASNLLLVLSGVLWIAWKYQFRPQLKPSAKILASSVISMLGSGLVLLLLSSVELWLRVLLSAATFSLLCFVSLGLLRPLTAQDFANLRSLLSGFGGISKIAFFLLSALEKLSHGLGTSGSAN
jgi:O-antigen/teichoic acid export membrane protein